MHLRMAWADRSQDCLSRPSSDADFFHLHMTHPAMEPFGLACHGLENRIDLMQELCEGRVSTVILGFCTTLWVQLRATPDAQL